MIEYLYASTREKENLAMSTYIWIAANSATAIPVRAMTCPFPPVEKIKNARDKNRSTKTTFIALIRPGLTPFSKMEEITPPTMSDGPSLSTIFVEADLVSLALASAALDALEGADDGAATGDDSVTVAADVAAFLALRLVSLGVVA